MLVLSRKPDERVFIGADFIVTLVGIYHLVARLRLESSTPFYALTAAEFNTLYGNPFVYDGRPHPVDLTRLGRSRRSASFDLRRDQSIVLPELGWALTITDVRVGQTRIGFDVPVEIAVHREEVWEQIYGGGDTTPGERPPP
ncbi:MAG: carbon storage regulator [Bdellovibrionota bacterium]